MENTSCFDWVVKKNFPEADFWLVNRGANSDLGKPVKDFKPCYTGILVPALVLPDYAYYLCVYIHSIGVWKQYGAGTTSFQNLNISDVRTYFKALSRREREAKQRINIKTHQSLVRA